MSNPFDRHGIDPLSTADEITERFRELIEDASDSERQALRDAWEALTLHPRSRIASALATFVETDPETIEPPPLARRPPGTAHSTHQSSPAEGTIAQLSETQKALLVPITDVLASLQRKQLCQREPTAYLPLASDPLLKEPRS